ncbi:MAG: CarD family transcriptional regulator [Clostridia bacterium]|nr:CarD family transcriptional regulator [Clostridia bacterium]
MYKIGDKVVYPMHGAGVIESIEEKEILGVTQKYYVMKMPFGDMKVMIPMSNCDEIGIRDIIDNEEADKVLAAFKDLSLDFNLNWNKRYRENMLKIKSGDVYEVARVVKALMGREKEKGLSTGERKMLTNAKRILISELVLAKNVEQEEIEEMLV